MISNKKLFRCRSIVNKIRKNAERIIRKNLGSLSPIVKFIDQVYQENNVERLFPTNVATGKVISHSHPLSKDNRKGSVTIDHGFRIDQIKVDTAFSTCFSSLKEKEYYLETRRRYLVFISQIRKRLVLGTITNFDLAIIFDRVFSPRETDFCKTLMGHRIGESLHEEPYLQMGLAEGELLVDEHPLLDGYYAIEIYFTKNLEEECINENTDYRRSIYQSDNRYIPYSELETREGKKYYDEKYFPLVSESNQRILQIEETFQLEGKNLVCISCDI